jgi:nicotinamide-nucleotide amidase
VRDVPRAEADAALTAAAARLRARVGAAIYGEDDDDLAAVVLQACRERMLTLGVAESCTGGMLGTRLTAVPGSSDVMRGGVIAYHDDLKRDVLGVEVLALRQHGAVSQEVVRQMAMGARRVAGASIGLAITGIAGPGGGTAKKPVGTVWVAADFGGDIHTRLLRLWGGREEIRQRSAQWLMEMVRRQLLGVDSGESEPWPAGPRGA